MKKRGRPPKSQAKRREERLDVRVSAAEKIAFKLAAETSEQDLSVWIRIQLHKAASEDLGDLSPLTPDKEGMLSNGKQD